MTSVLLHPPKNPIKPKKQKLKKKQLMHFLNAFLFLTKIFLMHFLLLFFQKLSYFLAQNYLKKKQQQPQFFRFLVYFQNTYFSF
jgi:hypothetical protein